MIIVFQQKRKKKKLFYHKKKKPCVIGEVKTKFFTTIVNQYKYQLTVVSY